MSPAENVREAADRGEQELDTELVVETPGDREVKFKYRGMARMPVQFRRDDFVMMKRVHQVIRDRINTEFVDLIELTYDVLSRVRTLLRDADGNVIPDKNGDPSWERTLTGSYVEHWDRLGSKERERYIFQITTNIIDWEQRSTEAWAEAMFAKARWREEFSEGYLSATVTRDRIEDREAAGNRAAADDYYFAILASYYSRQAEGLVRGMKDLGQRLKDIHMAASGRV